MWVQTRMGLGHLSRAMTLCGALAADGFEVVLAHGGLPVPALNSPPGVKLFQLPVALAGDLESSMITAADGRLIDDAWKAVRIGTLKAQLENFRPDIFITETFPLGRRLFSFELLPILAWIRSKESRPLIVASVRDVVTRPSKQSKADAMVDLASELYDMVLCHSDPSVIRLPDAFPETERLVHMTRYTGYVVQQPDLPAAHRSGILFVAGGGAAGAALFHMALQARPLWTRTQDAWTIVAGPRLGEAELIALRAAAPEDVSILSAVSGLAGRYAKTRLVVAQAGYNTVCEALSNGARLTVIPYATDKETEQNIRSGIFARRGFLTMVSAEGLSPNRLTEGMARALEQEAFPAPISFDGGREAARILRHAIQDRTA
jgi:predicted glycosyltransferase